MKMTKEHYETMKHAIDAVLSNYDKDKLVHEYETGQFAKADNVKDLQKRFCFDLLYDAGLNNFVSDNLYPYLNDIHLYTALKSICPKVTRRY